MHHLRDMQDIKNRIFDMDNSTILDITNIHIIRVYLYKPEGSYNVRR